MWKDIEFAKGHYQISALGEVRSVDRFIDAPNKFGVLYKTFKRGMPLRPQPNSKGYLRVAIHGKLYFVHRLVAEAFIPNPDMKPVVNHLDGNPLNNVVENLEWCTISENSKHAFKIGLHISIKGEDKSNSKLTEEQVRWILRNYQKGSKEFGRKPLARKFNVSHQLIKNIIDRKKWAHIQL